MSRSSPAPLAVATMLAALSAGCGYRVAGKADLLPAHIKTIAVPAFANLTTRYRLPEQLSGAVTREFIARTRYQVIEDQNVADALLQGTVVLYNSYPTTFDQATGRATAAQLSLVLDITLRERGTGKVLYSRSRVEFRDRYEISVDPNAYLEESDPALERVSRDVAREVVSAILETF